MTNEEIEQLNKDNNFYGYIETSAKNNIGIEETFRAMAEMLIKIYGKKKNKQNIKLTVDNQHKNKKKKCELCKPDI